MTRPIRRRDPEKPAGRRRSRNSDGTRARGAIDVDGELVHAPLVSAEGGGGAGRPIAELTLFTQ